MDALGCNESRAQESGGLRIGLADLALGELGAAGDELFDLGPRLGSNALRLGLGVGDDGLGLFLRLALLLLIVGEQLGGFVAQPAGFVELRLDPGAAVVE